MLVLFDDGKKWCKGDVYRDGSYCLLGAMIAVTQNVRGCDVTAWENENEIASIPSFRFLANAVSARDGNDVAEYNDTVGFVSIRKTLEDMRELEIRAYAAR